MKQDSTQGETREIEVTLTVRIKTVRWVVNWDWRRSNGARADEHGPETAAALLAATEAARP
ncbi:MAG TPA: hypothetical protein VII35_03055 [Steroidobacteraceae bacterium]